MIKINYGKIVKNTILITSVFLIGITTISMSFNSNARQQEIKNQELFTNPQSILNVTFKDNVYLDNIIDNELNSDKNWQGLKFDKNTFGISSLSGLSNIGGRDEMISINGQFNTRTIKKSYKDKLQELIVKIDDIKNNGSSIDNLDKEAQEEIKDELDKMNGLTLKRQRYWNWSQSKILNISLVGNTNTLTTIKTILDKSGHTKSNELTISKELQDKINSVKIEIDKELVQNNLPTQSELKDKQDLSKEEISKSLEIINFKSQEVINSEFQKTEEERKQIEANKKSEELTKSGKVNLSEEDYKKVNQFLTTDDNGNKVINQELLNNIENLNFTPEEKTIILDLIKSYNDMPSYQKNNIQSTIEQATENQNNKTLIQSSTRTKVEKMIGELVGGVESEAAHFFYGNGWESKEEWWRQGIRFPGWFISEMEYLVGNWGVYTATSIIISKLNIIAGFVCRAIALFCSILFSLLIVSYASITITNRYFCNGNGAWLYSNKIFSYYIDLSRIPYSTC